jgi:membrane peptidoglycan carboxypeptidase
MRHVTGGSAPAEAWRTYMAAALRRVHAEPIPPGTPGAAPPPTLVSADAPTPAEDVVDDLLSPSPKTVPPAGPPTQPPPASPDR